MTEMLKLEEQFAIVSEAERPAATVRVLKQDDTFAVYDPHGDVIPGPGSPYGLYHAGTRFLSCFELRLGRIRLAETQMDAPQQAPDRGLGGGRNLRAGAQTAR